MTQGPIETQIDRMLADAFEGDPLVLEAKFEDRPGLTFEETFRIVMRVVGAQNECLRLLAREVERLS